MKLHPNFKKTKNTLNDPQQYDDEVKMAGRKGGKAMKLRKQERQIDLEMRNYYTYR